jgi:phage shock protein C
MEENYNDPGENADENIINGNPDPKENKKQKKLYRSDVNRIFTGVCGGLGEFFNIDPIIFRLFFIISLLVGAWGVVIYVILSFVIPNSPLKENQIYNDPNFANSKSWTMIGTFMILLGIYLLVQDIGLLNYFSFFGFRHQVIIPAVLIIVLIMFIVQYDIKFDESNPHLMFARSDKNKIVSGVCSSFGKYFNMDVNVIRAVFIICTILTIGIGLIIYFLFAVLVPLAKEEDVAG